MYRPRPYAAWWYQSGSHVLFTAAGAGQETRPLARSPKSGLCLWSGRPAGSEVGALPGHLWSLVRYAGLKVTCVTHQEEIRN